MAKKLGTLFIVIGTACVAFALSLFAYNAFVDARAGKASEELLFDIYSSIGSPHDVSTPAVSDTALRVVEIDGYGYIGYVSFPTLDLELPVMDTWDYARLDIAPCRQSGSPKTDDMVIAAHNFKSHFGLLSHLKAGDEVLFTDMDGVVNTYEVAKVDTLGAHDVDKVESSGYALVLYTCTYSGQTRITVFCNRISGALSKSRRDC